MPLLHLSTLVLFLFVGGTRQDAAAKPDCRSVADCRQLALAAASRQDFELFHDLAWRAVQLGPKNDPTLMYLLARAQSLSGRPNDAIVMLARIVAMGVPVDAATNDDFRRVRALPGWPELAARISPAPAAPESAPPGKPVVPDRMETSAAVTAPPPVAKAPAAEISM